MEQKTLNQQGIPLKNQTNSPVPEYESFGEVLNEVRDVLIIDVKQFTRRISEELLLKLNPCPNGIYVVGQIEPIINFALGQIGYGLLPNDTENAVAIGRYEEFIAHNGPVVNKQRKIVCRNPAKLKFGFKQEPDVNYSLFWLVVGVVWEVLRSLSVHTTPVARVPYSNLNENNWISGIEDKQSVNLMATGAMQPMIAKIDEFIGRDYYANYTLNVSGLSIIVEKGNDFRIVEYYRTLFEKYDEEHFKTHGF